MRPAPSQSAGASRAATTAAVAKILKAIRRRLNVSQERLAVRAGLTRTYVGRVERGVLNPTIVTMNRVLGAIGVSWAEFGIALDAAEGD